MIKYAIPIIAAILLQWVNTAMAQDNKPLKQGRVVYEQLLKGGKTTVSINGAPQSFDRPDRIVRMEVLFTEEQSLRRQLETDERPEVEMAGTGASVRSMRMVTSFMPDATTWHNFAEARKVEQKDAAGKQYLVQDSIKKYTWKLTGESKTILGYTCQKAITQSIVKGFNMQMQDGQFKRTERIDTFNVTVWFAPAITVAAGPDFQGQLPGMILETESRNGSMVVRAVEISEKVKTSDIKEPKTGKKITQAEFTKEVDAMNKQMMERAGPMRTISF